MVTSGHGSFIETNAWSPEWTTWDAFIENGRKSKLGRSPQGEVEWKRLPFDWPIWILFSSGTTGEHRVNFLIDKTILFPHPLFRQAKVSSEMRHSQFWGVSDKPINDAGRSSTALVACFCSPEKSCLYVLISLTRTCFSIIPQRGRSNLAPLFKH